MSLSAWFIKQEVIDEFITHRYYRLEIPFLNSGYNILLSRSDMSGRFSGIAAQHGISLTRFIDFDVEFMAFETNENLNGISNYTELFCLREDVSFEQCLLEMGYDKVGVIEGVMLREILKL